MGQEDETASIEVARSAEFIVLDHNLFAIQTEEPSSALVDLTMVYGEIVYATE